ncbi:hypothetical protein [Spirosoma validum]|uniref:Uncharacterized protein n=1 Tax=Spirosoma validum TaxID=2771355 RepID=A0A927B1J0_9BACT|nr:hypothetical protein [Spirosoma validum]MBD2753618.1 hypothetical protein [Spirosoma validum]
MDNTNSLLYFASQCYKQVQLSVEKGTDSYTYGEFSRQFQELLEASGDAEYTKNMTILLVEEAARLKQNTDYLRQELAFEAKSSSTGNRSKAGKYEETAFETNHQPDLQNRRIGRNAR